MGSVDVSTLALLFGLMVISAQFRLGGFYSEVWRAHVRTGAPVTLATAAAWLRVRQL